jgi:hypothetical protein
MAGASRVAAGSTARVCIRRRHPGRERKRRERQREQPSTVAQCRTSCPATHRCSADWGLRLCREATPLQNEVQYVSERSPGLGAATPSAARRKRRRCLVVVLVGIRPEAPPALPQPGRDSFCRSSRRFGSIPSLVNHRRLLGLGRFRPPRSRHRLWGAQSLVVPFRPPVGTRGSVRLAARVGEWDGQAACRRDEGLVRPRRAGRA